MKPHNLNIFALLMVTIAFTLSGCVMATYTANPDGSETFKLTSFFKSVDGLYTEKGNGQFNLKMDKTHTVDPTSNMLEMMKIMEMIYAINPAGSQQ